MILYDGKSPIDWVYYGEMTLDEMKAYDEEVKEWNETHDKDKKDMRFIGLYSGDPCVLFDDGAGKVYSWMFLRAKMAEFEVTPTDDYEADFEALEAAMNKPVIRLKEEEIAEALAEMGQLITDQYLAMAELAALAAEEK